MSQNQYVIYSQADLGNNWAYWAKSIKRGKIVVQYVSFDFIVDHIFQGSTFRNIMINYRPD